MEPPYNPRLIPRSGAGLTENLLWARLRLGVDPEPATGALGAGHPAYALSREFLIKGAIGIVVLVSPQSAHDQRPFFGGQAQARPRKTISKKGRVRRKRARGQCILRNTGTVAIQKSALLIN